MKLDNFIFERTALRKKGNIDISYGKEVFRNNLTSIVAVARTRGIKVVLATQAACFRNNNHFPYIEKRHFLEYNEVIREVAEETGSLFVDCYSALDENTQYFIDTVHYSEEGIEKLADIFFHQITEFIPDKPK